MRRETPYALSTGIGGVVYEVCWYMRGLERWLMDMLVAPEFCAALLDRTLQFWLDYYTAFMAEVGDLVDVVMVRRRPGRPDRPALLPRVLSRRRQAAPEAPGSAHQVANPRQNLVSHLRGVPGVYP